MKIRIKSDKDIKNRNRSDSGMNKQTKIGNGIRSIAGSVLAIMMLSMLLMDSVSLNAFADGTDNTPFEVTQSV